MRRDSWPEKIHSELDYRWFQMQEMLQASRFAVRVGGTFISAAHVIESEAHLTVTGKVSPSALAMGGLLACNAIARSKFFTDASYAGMQLAGLTTEHILDEDRLASEDDIC